MCGGDTLTMPVHWYYGVAALCTGTSARSATTAWAGRGSQEGEVVGGVILKGKKPYWGRPNTH